MAHVKPVPNIYYYCISLFLYIGFSYPTFSDTNAAVNIMATLPYVDVTHNGKKIALSVLPNEVTLSTLILH